MVGKYLPTFSARDALASIWPAGGGEEELRKTLAALYGVQHVFLFRSARTALTALLSALGPKGVVVLPAYNCIAVPEAVAWAGWRTVLADIALGDVNMTHETLAQALPDEARAVILTHQFGLPPMIEPLVDLCRRRGLFIVEDAAPAVGARYRGQLTGRFGDAAVISFDLTKVLNAGHGGALLTNNDAVAGKVASRQAGARSSGSFLDFAKASAWWMATRPCAYGALRKARSLLRKDELYEVAVPNEQPPTDIFQSCSGYVARLAGRQIAALEANVAARQALARIYAGELGGVSRVTMPSVPEGAEPAWIQFPIFVEKKAACYDYLLKHGVDLNWTFRYSCGASYNVPHVPNAERAARTVLGLPTYPGLLAAEARRICDLLRRFFQG